MNRSGAELSFQVIATFILVILVVILLIIAFQSQISNLVNILKGFIE